MAQKVTFVDDLDGSEGAETISFAFKGKAYEIDLSSKNVDKLMKALQPFIDSGRAAGGQGTRVRSTSSGLPRVDYTDPQYAGNLHRGKVTEAEAKTVREHLDRINERLAKEGRPTIDASDPKQKERYGL